MPIFHVRGARKSDGREVVEEVVAKNEPGAREIAAERGIMVMDVLMEGGAKAAAKKHAATPPGDKKAPDYGLLRLAGVLLIAFGIITILVGMLWLGLGLKSAFGPTGGDILAGLVFVITGLGIIVSGVLQAAIGEGCHALRDIARNSWSTH